MKAKLQEYFDFGGASLGCVCLGIPVGSAVHASACLVCQKATGRPKATGSRQLRAIDAHLTLYICAASHSHIEMFDLGAQNIAGVRLEDDLVVTATGVRSLTNVPRTVEDVEQVMAGGEWPPAAKGKDAA